MRERDRKKIAQMRFTFLMFAIFLTQNKKGNSNNCAYEITHSDTARDELDDSPQ